MTNIKTLQNTIIEALTDVAKADAAVERAKERAGGFYTKVVAIAAENDAAAFDAAMEGVAAQVTTDGRLARSLKAAKRAKPCAKTGAKWKVPGSLKTAKSVIKAAHELGVHLTDDVTGEVRSFGAIRKDVREAQAAAKAEELTGDDLIRSEAGEYLARIQAALKVLTGDDLDGFADALATMAANAEEAAATATAEADDAQEAA